MTPIKPGEEDALRAYLEALPRARRQPVREASPRTHMARFVIVDGLPQRAGAASSARRSTSRSRTLIFSSNLDGDLDTYLDELCEALAREAPEIWGRCIGCPQPAAGAALKAYLKHNQIDCGFFFAAYGAGDGRRRSRRALDQRERLIDVRDAHPGHEPGRPAAGVRRGVRDVMAATSTSPTSRATSCAPTATTTTARRTRSCSIDCPPEQARAWFSGPARPRHDRRAVEGGQAADDAERRGDRRRAAGARRLRRGRRHVLDGVPRRAWPRGRRASATSAPSDPKSWEPRPRHAATRTCC